MTSGETLLEVRGLCTEFKTKAGILKAVDGVTFSLLPGRTVGIVGESGSGKTVTALSIMRLVDLPGRIVAGEVNYKGRDLLKLSEAEIEALRGDEIAMIFQDPMTSLNPVFRIGRQIAEGLITHQGFNEHEARRQTIELMSQVGIPEPELRYDDYPHQFSGGMRQRVLIAGAIACEPALLIADEPTTALDVTIQTQILKLIRSIQRRLGSALMLVTHDLGVVAAMADDVVVMYAGRIVECGSVEQIFHHPRHPYTQGLLRSLVRLEDARDSPLNPIPGLPPNLSELPTGCSFHPRCPVAEARCRVDVPVLKSTPGATSAACLLASETAVS